MLGGTINPRYWILTKPVICLLINWSLKSSCFVKNIQVPKKKPSCKHKIQSTKHTRNVACVVQSNKQNRKELVSVSVWFRQFIQTTNPITQANHTHATRQNKKLRRYQKKKKKLPTEKICCFFFLKIQARVKIPSRQEIITRKDWMFSGLFIISFLCCADLFLKERR